LDLSPFPPHGPTYFEILTAMALCHFARQGTNAVVLEVGLGGRLDSTNVCTPRVSVITSISLDHTQQLGESLSAIAAEKAGIIKPGVPVISGVTDREPRDVIRRIAAERGCRLVELGVDFDFEYHPPRHLQQMASPARFDFRSLASAIASGETGCNSRRLTAAGGAAEESTTPESTFRRLLAAGYCHFENLALALLGRHQAANAAIALAVLEELRRAGWTIPETAIRRGLAEVRWPARVEVVGRRPAVVLDAAHNAASIGALVEVLDESFSVRRRLLVFATTQGKDVRGMLQRLASRFDRVIFTRYLENPRGIPPEELQRLAAACWGGSSTATPAPSPCGAGVPPAFSGAGETPAPQAVEVAASPADAWDAIHRLAEPDDLVCITGSFFLAAEMRRQIAARPLSPLP
jgi:dihydrofolate synthase/folylpolyglutamate synthase